MPDLKSVLAWSAVAAGVAVVAQRQASRMRVDPNAETLDWDLVRRTAYSRAGADRSEEAEQASSQYEPLVAELVPLLAEACGTSPQTASFGRVRVVGRRGFVDQNLAMMRRMVTALDRSRGARPNPLMRLPTSVYVGVLLGYMGHRVLGQYDPVLSLGAEPAEDLPTPALLIVEPNVRDFERGSALPIDSLRRWLMLHELTHAWQFELHPWLAPHITGMVGELTELFPAGGPSGLEDLMASARKIRPQLATVGRLQAVMAVLEGHGNFIMREVGQRHLADYDSLDRAFHRRHEQPSPSERLLLLISGVAFKLQQYRQGEHFLREIQASGGQAALDLVWSGPEALPGWREVRHPELWLGRMGFGGAAGSAREPVPAPA